MKEKERNPARELTREFTRDLIAVEAKEAYMQGWIGNPDGADKPNKSYYDPRKWVREAEACLILNSIAQHLC